MAEPQGTSSGPLLQENSGTPHVLEVVQRRAKKASDYYHHVLANGSFRRESDDAENSRWSENLEQKRDLSDRPSGTVRSQPTTPVRLRPAKMSPAWVKPSVDDEKLPNDGSDKFQTFPKKIRAQDRMHDSSRSRKPLNIPGSHGRLQDKTNLANRFVGSSDCLSTVPRSSEDMRSTDNRDEHAFNSSVKAQSDDKQSNLDFTIAYTLPTSRPKRQQHYYETVELLPSQQRDRSHYYETVELPAKKEKIHNYEMIEVPSRSAVSGLRPNASTGNLKARSASSSPRKSPVNQQRRASGEMLSSDDYNGRRSPYEAGELIEPSAEIRRNKHHTFSGTSDHLARVEIRETLSSSGKSSPVIHRRSKSKSRSKSDVVDHQILLNQLQDIESEKDAQKLFAQHFAASAFSELTAEQARRRRHRFAHFDWRSMLFSFKDVLVAMASLKQKNAPTGASKAAALAVANQDVSSKVSSTNGSAEDVSVNEDHGLIYNRSNDLVANCSFFRNEIGGERERVISVSASSTLSVQVRGHGASCTTQAQSVLANHAFLSIVEHGSSRMLPPNSPPSNSVRFGIENIDGGALYYKTHFYETEHQNLVGIDERYGPIVVSIKREKLVDEAGNFFYQYRLIVRTSELCTLRGSILEDVISGSRLNLNKGYPIKDVLEYVCPEINASCLKLAMNTPKVQEQIMKVDEHNVQDAYKVGVLYCKAGQVTEEEMYNNENGCEHFERFLQLLGKKVKLNGFTEFKGGLDVTTDSTGTESVYTTFNGYPIMFHVSTLLPFTTTNVQQLLRKRHIGNDITTIVFQAPGSEPFNPQHVRSHFQHVFVIVRVHKPCSDKTCYSVAVTRSRNIPRFGPPIPENAMFSCSSTFREFLLTKVINGENTAHMAGKFKSLAMNTREQYLRDIAQTCVNPANAESGPRFARFSITAASRKIRDKDKLKPKLMPEEMSRGALTWNVVVTDYRNSDSIECILGISDCVLSIVEVDAKKLIFSIPCQGVLGWSVPPPTHEQLTMQERDLHIFFGRGERLSIQTKELESRDEIILRLERFTKGSETVYRQLRRNAEGELGFNINYEGIVMDVEPNGCAALDDVKYGSRLVEICKVSVATMTHDDILDLLRTSDRVTAVIIPAYDDGTPRKCSKDLYHLHPVLEVQKVDLKTVPATSRGGSVRRHASHRTERPSRHSAHQDVSLELYNSHMDSSQSEKANRRRSKRGSRKITDATLIATAAQLALVGFSTATYNAQDAKKETGGVRPSSSASNTLSSNYSGADVDWVEGSSDDVRRARGDSSSESGFNSNNNSSHASSLSRPQNEGQMFRDHDKRKPILNSNNNNNNNNLHRLHSSQVDPPRPSFSWRPVSKPEESKKGVQPQTSFAPTSYSFALSTDVITPAPFKLNWNVTSRSACDLSSSKFRPKFLNKKSTNSDNNGSRLRASIRHRLTSQSNQNCHTSGNPDVQSSLIRLLTHESPKKLMNRKPPSTRRESPKRKLSPLMPACPLPTRSNNPDKDEDAPRKYSPVFRIDDNPRVSDSLRQSKQRPSDFPLPHSAKWEHILNAAAAAEALHSPNGRAAKERSSGLCFTPDQASSLSRDDQKKFVNPLYAKRSADDVQESSKPERSASIRTDNSIPDSVSSESELKLQSIEREMKLLQDKLKEEQKSKKLLEEELSHLRRDNVLLLNKVKRAPLLNGVSIKKALDC